MGHTIQLVLGWAVLMVISERAWETVEFTNHWKLDQCGHISWNSMCRNFRLNYLFAMFITESVFCQAYLKQIK